jgi:retron-type reverse transcriptase
MLAKGQAFRLRNLGLPVLRNIADLAEELRLSESKVKYLCYRADFLYKVFDIPKKSGAMRRIAQPSRELKAVQAWILRNILNKLQASAYSKGFELNTSILDNATPHVGSTFVLNIDLEDFFSSISAASVYSIFFSIGYDQSIAAALTNLCVFQGALPQGAPTSPKLANLVCLRMDARIQGYSGPRGIAFTRYADDITLSAQTLKKVANARAVVEQIIVSENLRINHSKTKIAGTWRRREVTGLVLNATAVALGRTQVRKVRAKIYNVFVGKSIAYAEVNGWLAYAYGVDRSACRKLWQFVERLKAQFPLSPAAANLRKPKGLISASPSLTVTDVAAAA